MSGVLRAHSLRRSCNALMAQVTWLELSLPQQGFCLHFRISNPRHSQCTAGAAAKLIGHGVAQAHQAEVFLP